MSENYKPRRITVSEMSPHVHSFKTGENKVDKITNWLCRWITEGLKSGKVNLTDFLPAKGDLAFHIGVSLGTIQNVYRQLEDKGLVASKQKIGTFITNKNQEHSVEKLTSKRDEACEVIKKYIIENNILIGEKLVSSRELAKVTHISNTTLRLAINHLISIGILEKNNNICLVKNKDFVVEDIKSETLVKKITSDIKQKIRKKYKTGDKLPSNIELAKVYNVSVKTIHDVMKNLAKASIILTKRGRYGTIIADEKTKNEPYFYRVVEQKIKNYIIKNCRINDKLPSIKELSKQYSVSPKTIKRALDELSADGYINFIRGRFGGTFVTDNTDSKEGYTWLAISQDYIEN